MYSLSKNVEQAVDQSYGIFGMMDAFLYGMPEYVEPTRTLGSSPNKSAKESPLFSKVFHVPLPEPDELKFDIGQATALEAFSKVQGSLPNPYKTDIIVYDHADRGTLKITSWHQDDPRGEIPHDHPWEDDEGLSFVSYIVRGGYTETLYDSVTGETTIKQYRQGDLNYARSGEYHTVSNILPSTLTVLMCAPRKVVPEGQDPWGYLLINDDGTTEKVGLSDPRVRDNNFRVRAAVQNHTLRKTS